MQKIPGPETLPISKQLSSFFKESEEVSNLEQSHLCGDSTVRSVWFGEIAG